MLYFLFNIIYNYGASEASKILLGVDNWKSCICSIYYLYGLYVCPLDAHTGSLFFLYKRPAFFGLPPVSSGTTAVSKPYFRVRLKLYKGSLEIFNFSSHNQLSRVVTMALKPFTRCILKTTAIFLSIWVLAIKSHW